VELLDAGEQPGVGLAAVEQGHRVAAGDGGVDDVGTEEAGAAQDQEAAGGRGGGDRCRRRRRGRRGLLGARATAEGTDDAGTGGQGQEAADSPLMEIKDR
jgi:hypothetical protein